jgi:hypothetical protein
MTLVRVNKTAQGGFTILNLQMVTRMKCSGFDGGSKSTEPMCTSRTGGRCS